VTSEYALVHLQLLDLERAAQLAQHGGRVNHVRSIRRGGAAADFFRCPDPEARVISPLRQLAGRLVIWNSTVLQARILHEAAARPESRASLPKAGLPAVS
jgi:hypothetical protein